MEKILLNSEPRQVLGKNVKKLRREGKLPANLFGKDIKSTAVQVDSKEFSRIYNEAGATGVVELKLDGKTHPILISAVQSDPRNDAYLHADLLQVNLKDKITARIPIVLDGEAPLEKSGQGTVIQALNELEVESLPMDLPHEFVVDISNLENLDQTIQVKDIKVDSSKVEIKTDPESVVVLAEEVRVEEAPVEAEEGVTAEPEVIAEKGEEAEGEGETEKKEG